MKIDKIVHLNVLYDVYENLLTERQKEVYKYYYHEDLSYQEIAEILDISRAGAYDTLKRTRGLLQEMESKLQFVIKYERLIEDLRALKLDAVDEILEKNKIGGNYE